MTPSKKNGIDASRNIKPPGPMNIIEARNMAFIMDMNVLSKNPKNVCTWLSLILFMPAATYTELVIAGTTISHVLF